MTGTGFGLIYGKEMHYFYHKKMYSINFWTLFGLGFEISYTFWTIVGL